MTRTFSGPAFTRAFEDVVLGGSWQEESRYYPRYRSRYEAVLRRFSELAPPAPARVLEVGGGQLAALASRLWDDHVTVADIDETCFATLASQGIETFRFNLARDAVPVGREYDVVLLSEVIEHLPVPGHVAFRRLNALLRPGGTLVCSTPNLYRLRNVVYLATGRPIFDYFDEPSDEGRGHVLEYSAEHLRWQLERAGFADVSVELHEFAHTPNRRTDRVLSKIGKPLLRVPRFRDNLLATGKAP